MTEPPFSIPSRREYMALQRERHGRRLFGVFPANYPREILWALDILPVEIWDPPVDTGEANAHLQPYICSIVKLGLELILKGKCDELDGFLFPHTCDSIQNLASIIYDYLGLKKPCYFFYHPKAPYVEASRQYYMEHLKALVGKLERQTGALAAGALEGSIARSRELAGLLREVYRLRSRGELAAGNRDFYRIIRLGEYLHPDDFSGVLKTFIEKARGASNAGLSVVMSGILPCPPEILTTLDQLQVRVGEDDFLCCGRRLLFSPGLGEDPYEALAEGYFRMPPCSTKGSSIRDRVRAIEERVLRSGSRGVIFTMVKFCEPELFDVPQLAAGLGLRGIPSLVLDCEVNQGLSGQAATRVEAFIEMLGQQVEKKTPF